MVSNFKLKSQESYKKILLDNLPTIVSFFFSPVFALGALINSFKVFLFIVALVVCGDAYVLWVAPSYDEGMIYPEAAKVLSFTPVVALIYAKAFALNVHLIAGYLCGNAWRNRDSVRSSTLKGFVSGIMYLAAVTPLFVVSIQLGGQIKTIEAKMEAWQLTNSFIQDLKKTHPEINTKDFEKRLRDLSFNYVPKFND